MKFVVLGAGAIAARFLNLYCAGVTDASKLVAVIAPEKLLIAVQESQQKQVKYVKLDTVQRQEAAILDVIADTNPDFLLSIQYPWILSPLVLKTVKGKILNLHNARLPEYRGHNTISHELLNGETVHTTTLHWIAEEVDRGRIASTRSIPIAPDDTAFSLWCRSVDASVELLNDFITRCEEVVAENGGQVVPPGGHYYHKTSIQYLKRIPADASLERIDRISRAFWFPPHEPAHFEIDGRKLFVLPNSYRYEVQH